MKCVCGVIEPGFASTWPRSTSSRFVPRRSAPALSPAWAKSSVFWNISRPVTMVFAISGWMPTMATSSPDLIWPCSIRPVTTVPRPGIVDHVGLVQRDDDERHLDLAGEQDVLARLGHRPVGRRDHEDRAVHLGGARDHVLDVVGVTRAVDVRVVAVLRLVLDMRGVDRDAALPLLGSVVDRREVAYRGVRSLLREHLGDRRRQRRLAVVDVTDRSDVEVRLRALELLLCHASPSVAKPAGRSARRRSTAALPRSGRIAS